MFPQPVEPEFTQLCIYTKYRNILQSDIDWLHKNRTLYADALMSKPLTPTTETIIPIPYTTYTSHRERLMPSTIVIKSVT